LAIIQAIDNDIRCDGTDDAHVPEFGAALDDALAIITEASPDTKILLMTALGRPAAELETMADLINSEPAARALYTGPAPCGMLDDSGAPQPENIATLTSIIESYEAEQQRVCDKYPTCSTDEGALATFRREPSMVSSDFIHLNLEGQRRLAEAVWPTVQSCSTNRETPDTGGGVGAKSRHVATVSTRPPPGAISAARRPAAEPCRRPNDDVRHSVAPFSRR
jgi:lysophospholipase L1-like esterase